MGVTRIVTALHEDAEIPPGVSAQPVASDADFGAEVSITVSAVRFSGRPLFLVSHLRLTSMAFTLVATATHNGHAMANKTCRLKSFSAARFFLPVAAVMAGLTCVGGSAVPPPAAVAELDAAIKEHNPEVSHMAFACVCKAQRP